MPGNEPLKTVVDWDLPPREFERQVDQLILQYTAGGKVIPLPIALPPNGKGQDLLVVMLAKIDCSGCDAICCREQPANEDKIAMAPAEFEDLKRKYPTIMHSVHLSEDSVTAPCPLLKDGRCQVYHDRPFVCWLYPFEFGAWTVPEGTARKEQLAAVSSSCPEARKLAKGIYLSRYQQIHSLQRLGFITKDKKKT